MERLTEKRIKKEILINKATRPFVEKLFPEIETERRIDEYYKSEQGGEIQVFPEVRRVS